MNNQIDWRQNCLTGGVHAGREGAIWSIPLGYAVVIFDAETLRELVLERIYSDAMQMVEHGEGFTQAWANTIKQRSEELYPTRLQVKVGEITNHYRSAIWRSDQQRAVTYVKEDKLNLNYEPLHSHDTIDMLCRIIGVSASRNIGTRS